MCAETVDGVRNALAVFVERLGGRIVGGFSADDITALVEREFIQLLVSARISFINRTAPSINTILGLSAHLAPNILRIAARNCLPASMARFR